VFFHSKDPLSNPRDAKNLKNAIIRSQTMGRLANILQNYYTTKGNKIVFKNGLTLNGFSDLMWERFFNVFRK